MDLTLGDGEGLMWMQLYSESAAKMTEVFQKFIIVNFMQSITPICWSLEVLLSVNIPVGGRHTNSACILVVKEINAKVSMHLQKVSGV